MQRTLPVLALFLISPPHVTVAPIQHTVSVSGIVKNEDDGSPIAGAQVMLAADEDDEAPPAPSNVFTTGPDGRFRIPAPVRASRTWLVAYKHGFPPGESDDVDPKNGGRDIVIVMGKGFEVAGTVCDAAGHPLRGVAVTAQDAGSVLFGTPDPSLSDSEGRFSTLVSEGDWQLTFSREGYLPRIVSVLEVTGAIDAVDVELEPAAAIRGRVVRMDGSGVDGVQVFEYGLDGATTAADGSFSLPAVSAGLHELGCWAPGGARGSASVTAPADDVRIVLDDAGAVRGRVVDAAGVPVTSFSIDVMQPPKIYSSLQHFTNADGRFLWNDAPAGEVTVRIKADGFVTLSKDEVVVEAGSATGEITFALRRARTLRGRAVSITGHPLAEVSVVDEEQGTLAETAADGTYEVDGLASVPTSFEYEKSGFVSVVRDVPPGHDDVTIDVQLRPALILTGRVLTPDGQPLAGAYVSATSTAGGTKPLYAQTNGRGEFRLEGLALGRYDLTAGTRANGEQPRRTPWLQGSLPDVDVEQAHDVTIRTRPRISGVIYGDITGINPVPKEVKIFASSSTHWSDASNDEARASYRMVDAPTGTVTIHATAGSRETRPVVIDVEPNGQVRADLHFAETFPVRGRVNGDPLFSTVEFKDEYGRIENAFTKSDGTYEAELPAGQYRVTVGSYVVDHAISGPETFDIDVDLAPITVTVVDALTGAPVDEAKVRAYRIPAGGKTDRNGQATFDAPHGAKEIEVEKEGYGTAIVAAEPALLVKLTPSEETVVHIVDGRDGRPLSGWAMARDADGRLIFPSRATKGGRSYFRLPPGQYRLSASAEGYGSQTIAADVPSADVRIPLPRGARLLLQSRGNLRGTARLIQPDGEEYVRCWGNAIAEIRLNGHTSVVEPVAPGSYTLEIRQTGTKPRTIAVSVGEGETVTVPIDP